MIPTVDGLTARPVYRKDQTMQKCDQDMSSMKSGSKRRKLVSEQSLTLRRAFQQLKPIQVKISWAGLMILCILFSMSHCCY